MAHGTYKNGDDLVMVYDIGFTTLVRFNWYNITCMHDVIDNLGNTLYTIT